jgi:hypothetical protein
MRFPNRGVAVLNDGDAAMGIHRQESLRIEPAEVATGVDMFVRKVLSSPISHMTFWTLNELRRPQTFSIFSSSESESKCSQWNRQLRRNSSCPACPGLSRIHVLKV